MSVPVRFLHFATTLESLTCDALEFYESFLFFLFFAIADTKNRRKEITNLLSKRNNLPICGDAYDGT